MEEVEEPEGVSVAGVTGEGEEEGAAETMLLLAVEEMVAEAVAVEAEAEGVMVEEAEEEAGAVVLLPVGAEPTNKSELSQYLFLYCNSRAAICTLKTKD